MTTVHATIRAGTPEDARAVAGVNIAAWRSAFAGLLPDDFLARLSVEARTTAFTNRFGAPGYGMWVSETPGGLVVGFADWGPPRDAVPHDCELYAIHVLPEYQGRGAGRGLFRKVAAGVLSRGQESLVLSVLRDNPHRGFYHRLGGVECGRSLLELDGRAFETVGYEWRRPALERVAAS